MTVLIRLHVFSWSSRSDIIDQIWCSYFSFLSAAEADELRWAAACRLLSVLVLNVCVLLSAQCQLEIDTGIQCDQYVQAWFFDKNIGACSPFWYGGCGGNANRFKTETECFRTCGAHSKSCLHTSTESVTNMNVLMPIQISELYSCLHLYGWRVRWHIDGKLYHNIFSWYLDTWALH